MQIKKEQTDFLDWQLGAFFHFGIRTFFEGHRDWDGKPMPADQFNPKKLDCNQWMETLKKAGAKYAILVCKHHDGFANWPSAYTDYSVKNTPWKNGQGDVVREFVDACRAYGIKVGLYYSPAQADFEQTETTDYDNYFINQISELLTNYGKIDYLWFDGCGSENHEFDTKRITAKIRELQPNILIFNMWDPDTRWVGNESGLAHIDNRATVNALDFSVQTDRKDALDEEEFLPAECDCRLRLRNWFYSDLDADTIKSVDELMGLYYYSVGRGANLLINIAPNRDGLLPEKDAARFIEFGEKVQKTFAHPIADTIIEKTVDGYSVKLKEHTVISHIKLSEDVYNGENITGFKVYIAPYSYGRDICVYTGETVGYRHICHFPAVRTEQVKIVLEGGTELKDIVIYKSI